MTVLLPDQPNQVFERGDKIYMTTPVQVFTPTADQIEEYAFADVVKSAPNENIVWLKGQYVEADNPNLNGAQWTAKELAIKNLTPMLMPVTVMHDPRTAVGTIADTKLLTPEADGVKRARIDTILALWGHRFPEAVQEAVANAQAGSLMQSMECFSPWYCCSECSAVFHKLPGGAEQANWCNHLKASNPNAGYVDLGKAAAQSTNASRILGDVCFTGTGLIYGSRGVKGAYTEAHLDMFQTELAAYHESAHNATATETSTGGPTTMGLVQIDENELKILRTERDEAKAALQTAEGEKAAAEKKAEEAEAAQKKAEEEQAAAVKEKETLEEQARAVKLRDDRMGALGAGFVAKLGDFTKNRLEEQSKSMSDEDWDNRLKELEELASVKRDAKADEKPDPSGPSGGPANEPADKQVFGDEEIAAFVGGTGEPQKTGGESVQGVERSSVVGKLAAGFKPKAKSS